MKARFRVSRVAITDSTPLGSLLVVLAVVHAIGTLAGALARTSVHVPAGVVLVVTPESASFLRSTTMALCSRGVAPGWQSCTVLGGGGARCAATSGDDVWVGLHEDDGWAMGPAGSAAGGDSAAETGTGTTSAGGFGVVADDAAGSDAVTSGVAAVGWAGAGGRTTGAGGSEIPGSGTGGIEGGGAVCPPAANREAVIVGAELGCGGWASSALARDA